MPGIPSAYLSAKSDMSISLARGLMRFSEAIMGMQSANQLLWAMTFSLMYWASSLDMHSPSAVVLIRFGCARGL